MSDNPRRFAETLGSGEEVHAHWGGRASDVHEKCRKEIERLRKAIVDYVMTVSDCYSTPATDSDALELLKQAVRGE